MNKILVAPSILSADFGNMAQAVINVKEWGGDIVHCDVMDGVFVPNLTFGMPMVQALRKYTDLPLDCHLMIIEPEKYVERFCDAGADYVTFHPDASKDVRGALEKIKAKGVKCGLVLNPDKPLSMIEPYLDIIDMLLIMSVYAGFGGQKFIEESIKKLEDAKKMLDGAGREILLEIDGGISEKNAKAVAEAGAQRLVAGNAVFTAENPESIIKQMKNYT
mgnify:FL=1